MAEIASTISGPVDSPRPAALTTAPDTPASVPNSADSTTMAPRLRVHCRAAVAGAMIMAVISTTPTICNPTTTARATMAVIAASSARTGSPSEAAKPGSKETSLNSFQTSATRARAATVTAPMIHRSLRSMAAACPNRNESSPPCAPSPRPWMNVSRTTPRAKNRLSAMPRAASVLSRLVRVSSSTVRAAAAPVARAPSMMLPRSRAPAIRNPRQTPGSAAWASVSPSRLCRRSTAKQPRTPLEMPSSAAPRATVRMVESASSASILSPRRRSARRRTRQRCRARSGRSGRHRPCAGSRPYRPGKPAPARWRGCSG